MIIALHRVRALILRHLFLQLRDLPRIADILFWPQVDIILWGFTGFVACQDQTTYLSRAFIPLIGAFFWQYVLRGSMDIAVSVLEEFWQHNMFNLFSTPLTLAEWALALMTLGLIRVTLITIVCSVIVWIFFKFTILSLGIGVVPVIASLILSGWVVGFVSASLIIYWGQRMQAFVWGLPWLIAPFSAVFYPLAVLPHFMRMIGKGLPMTYVFETLRHMVDTGCMRYDLLSISLMLNVIYLAMAMTFFSFMFNKSKQRGLVRLERE